jgi:folate-binding protein YgfZ
MQDPLSDHAVADLSDRVKLILTGADRVRYLNGQVTSDVRKLPARHTQPACVTTAKGKLCADIVITATDDAFIVDADAALRESLPARLGRYIIADDVVIDDATDSRVLLHFFGEPPAAIEGAFIAESRRYGREGWDVHLAAAGFATAKTALLCGRRMLHEARLESLRIEAGIPRWGRELGEDTLPPEAGLDRTHIDYHKGCYIGQEVISRLKSVGHVNRQLTGFISADDAPLAAGAEIFAAGEERPAGILTSAAFSFALEKQIALGYLKRGSPTRDLFARPADSTGAAVRVTTCALPFVA